MEHIRSLANSTLTPSSLDLLLAVPRLAQRAGEFAFLYLPEQFDAIIGKARSGGSVIAEPTASGTNNSTIITSLGQFVQGSIASATANPPSSGPVLDNGNPFSMANIRSFGGIFSYLMSKWALTTVIMAVFLNRTQFYASSRVPLTLRWYLRLSLYMIPITSFLFQIRWILQALHCQTSPQWPAIQYGEPNAMLGIDYAAEGGMLHWLSSALVFGEDDIASCSAVNMLPKGNDSLRVAGSMKLLWPLFLSLGLSQFIETLACSLQGRTPMPETGMTIFEHSLAFAEAEATITRPFLRLTERAAKAATSSSAKVESTVKTFTRSAVLQATNVPPEVLVISLISSLSHLSSNILAVAGLRTRFRLVNTGIWGLSYMVVFMWSFSRAVSSAHDSVDAGILRFPTVCIVGFIPHLLIFMGMIGCALIYGLAVLLTAIALPPAEDAPASFWGRANGRLAAAYRNLQVNVYLRATPSIRISWNEDFYTALLKIGFTILTAASEAVYLNEGTKVAVSTSTWLEEKRVQELVAERKGLRRAIETIPVELVEEAIADGVVSLDDSTGSIGVGSGSGYARERKAKGRKGTSETSAALGREHGVGFVQRRSRWVLAFSFLTGLLWIFIGLAARVTLSALQTLRIPWRPRWLSRVIGRETLGIEVHGSKRQRQSAPTDLKTLQFWVIQPDGSLGIPNDGNVDVEAESRRRYDEQLDAVDVEPRLDSFLYNWWKSGGWWGDIDSSGDYNATVHEDDDDLTSMISETDASELDWVDSDSEDGRRTPTQRSPHPQSRESTPMPDDLLNSAHLATLLDPKSPSQREEARLLASHLRSNKPLTRSQHRKALEHERSRIIASSARYFAPDRTPEEEERALETFLLERRAHSEAFKAKLTGEGGSWAAGAEGMGSSGPQCVVCQASPRTVLMWPCSCLSLCDDCRVGLATRNFTACVCCRTTVVAYSRLYVP